MSSWWVLKVLNVLHRTPCWTSAVFYISKPLRPHIICSLKPLPEGFSLAGSRWCVFWPAFGGLHPKHQLKSIKNNQKCRKTQKFLLNMLEFFWIWEKMKIYLFLVFESLLPNAGWWCLGVKSTQTLVEIHNI